MNIPIIFKSENLYNQVKLIDYVLNGKRIITNESNYDLLGFTHNVAYDNYKSKVNYKDAVTKLASNIKKSENDDLYNICMMIHSAVVNLSLISINKLKFNKTKEISVERNGFMDITINSPYKPEKIKSYFKLFYKYQDEIFGCLKMAKLCIDQLGSIHMYIFYAYDAIKKEPDNFKHLMIDILYRIECIRRLLGLSSASVFLSPCIDIGSIIIKDNYILFANKDNNVFLLSKKDDLYSLGINFDNTAVIDRILKGKITFRGGEPFLNKMPLSDFIN